MAKKSQTKLDSKQLTTLLETLQLRFEKNMLRHPNADWEKVLAKLKANDSALWSLYEMERTGGEPDLVFFNKKDENFVFIDCSKETPQGRRSLCYDRKALDARKANKPVSSAMDMAAEMGIELLNEEQYCALQKLEAFDLKTSSWLKTPDDVRSLGGAIFGDRRFDRVFIYHNGADSYYAARGFRGWIAI